MSLVSDNIKHLRKQMHFTQEQMAEKIGIKRSLLGAYEEGRADPRLINLQKMAEIFSISVDKIISTDLSNIPLTNIHKDGKDQGLRVLAITTDRFGKENIELVPYKASAGYLNGYADPEYLEELPKFNLPGLNPNTTYRAFEISGDSMLPLQGGTIIVGRFIQKVDDVRNDKLYVLLTKSEGVVFKRVYIDKEKNALNLVSDNKLYNAYKVSFEEIIEIWEAVIYISKEFPESERDKLQGDISFDKLKDMVLDLQQEVMKLKTVG